MPRVALVFGPFQIDERSHDIRRDGDLVALPDRHATLLWLLASNPGDVVSKEALVRAGWGDIAVTDNSVEQVISSLRRVLGPRPDGRPRIETIARRGYRFADAVRRVTSRESDATLEALLAPHRGWVEGRAALETLHRDHVLAAKLAFAQVLATSPDYPLAHIGMANACAFLFESTRADETPDAAALVVALRHAREGCRLDPESAEAWASLAFVLHRAGDETQAIAAARRAVSLEPDNWRHYLRLSIVSWGDERLRSARHTLHLLPGLALAHWLAATVHVARQAFEAAERELDAGAAAQDLQGHGPTRFSAVGLHWLRGLVRLQHGDEIGACDAFRQELAFENSGHLYERECCANAWYAIGAVGVRRGAHADAVRAFDEVLRRIPGHVLAMTAKAALADKDDQAVLYREVDSRLSRLRNRAAPIDVSLAMAVRHVRNGKHECGAAVIQDALCSASPGSAGWLIPVEPMLAASARPGQWAHVFALLRTRSA